MNIIDFRRKIRPLNEDKDKRKERKNKKMLIFNTIGFSAILLLDFNESNLFVNIFISLFVLANLLLFFLWERINKNLYFQINLLTALVAFVTGYDYYSKGSQHVYLIWFLIGCVYIVLAFIKKHKEKS